MNIAFIAVLNLTVTVRSIIIYLTYAPKVCVRRSYPAVLYVVPLLVITNKNDICFCGLYDCQERHI